VPEVRLIDDEGRQVGVMKIADALSFAQERELDLVEVAPEARPPVCRVLDYSKYKYEQAQKLKQARKHQQQITVREIKFRPKIAQHDYDTKKGHVERFLRHKDKVKVTIMFRGREVTHPERGTAILDRLAEELTELGVVEQRPVQEGRNMTMLLAPSKAVLSGKLDGAGGEDDAAETGDATEAGEAPAAAPGATAAAAEVTDAAAEATDAAAEATDAAAEATDAAAEVTDAAPEATDAAPKATDAAPETTDTAPETTDTAPETTDTAPEATDAAGSETAVVAPEGADADAEAAPSGEVVS
jgi:translation initiation factor IF-3